MNLIASCYKQSWLDYMRHESVTGALYGPRPVAKVSNKFTRGLLFMAIFPCLGWAQYIHIMLALCTLPAAVGFINLRSHSNQTTCIRHTPFSGGWTITWVPKTLSLFSSFVHWRGLGSHFVPYSLNIHKKYF